MAHITLYKTAAIGQVFRPEDFNGNMTIIEVKVNAIDDDLITTMQNVLELLVTVGTDPTSGLIKAVDDLEAAVGSVSSGLIKELNDAEAAIGDLETLTAKTTGSANYDAASSATSGNIGCSMRDGVVVAQISFGSTGGFTTADEVISEQLPLAFRPLAAVRCAAVFCTTATDGATFADGMIYIDTSGYVHAACSVINKTIVVANASWIV